MIKARKMKILVSESNNKKKLTQYVYLNVSFIIKFKKTKKTLRSKKTLSHDEQHPSSLVQVKFF